MMRKILMITSIGLIAFALLGAGLLMGQVNAQGFQPGSMMGYPGHFQDGYPMHGADCPMGGGMIAGFNNWSDADPLSIEQAETAVSNYLAGLNDDNLFLAEIMIFDNHAYAQVWDAQSEHGAFELLVNPVTQEVFPEPGPNMMWNTEYGMMGGQYGGFRGGRFAHMMGGGMMGYPNGGMMGGWGFNPTAEINVSEEEALQLAQDYLDEYLPGATAADHAQPFPGYYTLHVLQDGQTSGMLSVNAASGQVFYHHWHGTFIEMSAAAHSD